MTYIKSIYTYAGYRDCVGLSNRCNRATPVNTFFDLLMNISNYSVSANKRLHDSNNYSENRKCDVSDYHRTKIVDQIVTIVSHRGEIAIYRNHAIVVDIWKAIIP